MVSDAHASPETLSPDERERFERLRAATSLADLQSITDATSPQDAYFSAKDTWRSYANRALNSPPVIDGVPGRTVSVGGVDVHLHGVTHAGTDAERSYLQDRIEDVLSAGHDVYCEQGIRRLYFDAFQDVCEMDDYE